MKKPAAKIEHEIAVFLAAAASPGTPEVGDAGMQAAGGPRVKLPRYNEREGLWQGGDSRTLYAFTEKRVGRTFVLPGGVVHYMGPEVTVRIATRDEAERLWQRPLHRGWNVA